MPALYASFEFFGYQGADPSLLAFHQERREYIDHPHGSPDSRQSLTWARHLLKTTRAAPACERNMRSWRGVGSNATFTALYISPSFRTGFFHAPQGKASESK